jgi:hypothetical protein
MNEDRMLCPFCDESSICSHFMGWTDDGRKIEMVDGSECVVQETDRIIKTGTTARVYRPSTERP